MEIKFWFDIAGGSDHKGIIRVLRLFQDSSKVAVQALLKQVTFTVF